MIGVLILIHHHVAILLATCFEYISMFREEPQREQNQIVEVHGIAGVEGALVAASHVFS